MPYVPDSETNESLSMSEYRLRIHGPLNYGLEARIGTADLFAEIRLENQGLSSTEYEAAKDAADEKFQELIDLINGSPNFSASGSKISKTYYGVTPTP